MKFNRSTASLDRRPFHPRSTLFYSRAGRVLCGASIAALTPAIAQAQKFDPYPVPSLTDDFGGVGLMQTPTARFAPDGQLTAGYNQVSPYDRYFVTLQPTPWLEATLRYTSVGNRRYSDVPAFSGNQSFKDRGFDLKLKILGEGRIRPALALGFRDFLGTGLFSSEYLVANKSLGPFDFSFGVGWGNLATRGPVKNPFTSISSRFDERKGFTGSGGDFNFSDYFAGRRVGLFGGIQYVTPIRGLTVRVEYDPNDYQHEALDNRFRDRTAINAGFDYRVTSWLHAGASYERGNKFGFTLTATTNFNRQAEPPKFDPPGDKVGLDAQPIATPPTPGTGSIDNTRVTAIVPGAMAGPAAVPATGAAASTGAALDERARLSAALAAQGSALYAAHFSADAVELFVAQGRFRNMATGLGRTARAAFSVLPAHYTSVKVVFVENGMATIAATVPRAGLVDAVRERRGPAVDALLKATEFAAPPLTLNDAEYQAPLQQSYPRFYYSLRPGLKTTLGRPEQFVLYQAYAAVNGGVLIRRGLSIDGQVTLNISDNFDKLRIPSNSTLPHVRSDIASYLDHGKTAIAHLEADYNFNIAPSLYGHVYGGILEEMFTGVGGEVLYRPHDVNWAIGANVAYVAQRDFDERFDLRDYRTVTGFVTGYYSFPRRQIDVSLTAGRYLAKDWGATFDISRRFESGVRVGAFATKTNVSAAKFGEGSFDKGIYLIIPLDLLYNKHVRSSIGIAYRPLIRDGGQQLVVRQPLIGATDPSREANFIRDWDGVTE